MMGARYRSAATCLAVGLATLSAPSASAQPAEPQRYGAERFRLALDADGILAVEWADIPEHLSWDIGLWLGVADDPVVLERGGERVGRLVDTRIGGSAVLTLALFDWVQLGVELPVVLYQERPSDLEGVRGAVPDLTRFALGAPRISPKLRLVRQEAFGIALSVMPSFVLPSIHRGDYVGQDDLRFEPELVASREMGVFRSALNVGLRLRRPEPLLGLEVDDELFARVGGALDLGAVGGPPLSFNANLSVATALDDPFGDARQTHLEVMSGAGYGLTEGVEVFGGAGVGLESGHGTPDWRALVGLRLFEHQRDRDQDGVLDEDDGCDELPEDIDGFEDGDGCPEADNDGDGVVDKADGAPLDPEDLDGFADEDGVPDPDDDGDGVLDWDDACRREPGPVVNLGCPDVDADADGRVDRLDACPERPEDVDGFEDEDGCPDPDDDGDGVPDGEDDCPRAPGPAGNRGCPDRDTDGDGVVDRLDNCPTAPGPADLQGCADKQLVVITDERLEILDRVYFASGRARIRRRSFPLLDNVAAVLIAHPEIRRIEIQGHTDDRGGARANQRLSEQRAQAVRRYLTEAGVDPERLTAKGYGESEPIAPNQTRQGRAENRRVEFRILRDRGGGR